MKLAPPLWWALFPYNIDNILKIWYNIGAKIIFVVGEICNMGYIIFSWLIIALIVRQIWRKARSLDGRPIIILDKGRRGEARVRNAIGLTVEGSQYVINDLLLSVGENKTCQIDHVLINRNGIFVIETKNYAGRIYGQENQREWTQVLGYGNVKNKLYNPIKQNKTHIYHISNILTEKLPIISAVVFVEGNTHFIDAEGVYSISELKRLIQRPYGNLSPLQMKRAYTELINAHDSSVSKSEHIKNIHSMQADIANNICPRCGKKLVLKNGKYGNFYGCSGYPRCKFIKKL